jgi:hypothetical protein
MVHISTLNVIDITNSQDHSNYPTPNPSHQHTDRAGGVTPYWARAYLIDVGRVPLAHFARKFSSTNTD